MYNNGMMKNFIIGALVTTTSAVALPAYACGFHGGGYGKKAKDQEDKTSKAATIQKASLDSDR